MVRGKDLLRDNSVYTGRNTVTGCGERSRWSVGQRRYDTHHVISLLIAFQSF